MSDINLFIAIRVSCGHAKCVLILATEKETKAKLGLQRDTACIQISTEIGYVG